MVYMAAENRHNVYPFEIYYYYLEIYRHCDALVKVLNQVRVVHEFNFYCYFFPGVFCGCECHGESSDGWMESKMK